jgi:hypothetical protein
VVLVVLLAVLMGRQLLPDLLRRMQPPAASEPPARAVGASA